MAVILIASDNAEDAKVVKQQLEDEHEDIFISINPDMVAQDFDSCRPDILVLAFNGLEKAEHYYLGLYRLSSEVHTHSHRTIILCNKDEVKRVYGLCQKDYFDDYILFWPTTHDFTRLAMAVYHAMNHLAALKASPSAMELVVQARKLAGLEYMLDSNIARGGECIESASNSIACAKREIKASLDGFSKKLMQGDFANLVDIKDAKGLQNEIGRFQQETIRRSCDAAVDSMKPLKTWAQEFRKKCAPHIESARTLRIMAEKVSATILVVDDDELMRKSFRTVLAEEKYDMMFAAGGIEALSLLRKRCPDLILMDMMMPGIDGIETLRRIKSSEQFASIPVIMVTGNSKKSVVTNCLKAGAAGFVVKPFNRKILLDKVRKFLYDLDTTDNSIKEPKQNISDGGELSAVKKSWKSSDLFNPSKDAPASFTVLNISWLQLKPGMEVESVYFDDKPYIRNCIVDQKIINNIVALRENTGINPIIKIRLSALSREVNS